MNLILLRQPVLALKVENELNKVEQSDEVHKIFIDSIQVSELIRSFRAKNIIYNY